ncbi:phosphopantetheine-binding protein, partial [Sinomicrobium oceani]|uniref:phosphopantetheine-binding protein n=1 Tax=Sinomicrobium oceani TaxID=1150368 RepID=UPI00227BF9CA
PMEALPLTVNGKLDKKALPDPGFESSKEDYVQPTTDIEIALCNIWQEVLGLERVGTTDDFFRIGGDSILAIQVSHWMTKVLDREVTVADVFEYKSIRNLLKNTVIRKGDDTNVDWEV